MPDDQHEGDKILHEEAVKEVIDAEMTKKIALDAVTIADAVVAAGSAPTKAEFDALVGKFNSLLAVARTENLIAGA